ncbi:MAG: hypothetical protein L0027_10840 [Candidatus Rokubacteria bacterium]|nr:hypothetical protein [Candidatus Rokubacteria bacterium]
MTSRHRYVREGIIAGMIGAAIVAVWFLIYDAARGQPFRTPALLGAATFRGVADPAATPVSTGLIVQYTVLHGVVFALIGILLAYLIASAQREPGRLLTLVIAVLSFEVVFLALLKWLAPPVLVEVMWWAVLTANVLASAGMLVYFFVGHRALGRGLLGSWTQVLREGSIAGLLGAAAVAAWFLLYDLAAGAPLRTPALLGAAIFEGLRDPSTLVITPRLVFQFTLLHVGLFLGFGWAVAGLLALADREPRLLYALFMLFCCFEVFFVAVVWIAAEWLFETLPIWAILAGNLLSALVMLAFFFRGHRVALRAFLSADRT